MRANCVEFASGIFLLLGAVWSGYTRATDYGQKSVMIPTG
jgi:hypothetical protein